MKWASSVSRAPTVSQAAENLASDIKSQLRQASADLGFLFISPHFVPMSQELLTELEKHLPMTTLVGCSGGGVVGDAQEIEDEPGVSLTAAVLPGVEVHPIHVHGLDPPDEDASPEQWKEWLGGTEIEQAHFVMIADPFSSAVESFLAGLDYVFPKGKKVGGLASGGQKPNENVLFLNQTCHREGVVLVALQGNIHLDTIVAQGCRPIGRPLSVTRCEQNILLEVDHCSPIKYLEETAQSLDSYDLNLLRTSLFLGLGTDSFNKDPQPGDFLIRNLMGVDYEAGAMAVGAMLHTGQQVQFHLRDGMTSTHDLERMLDRYKTDVAQSNVSGALLFSCLGRGRRLFGEPNHDSDLFVQRLGSIPLGGFFCHGEIGPVGATTFLHGYTSAFALFKPLLKEPDAKV